MVTKEQIAKCNIIYSSFWAWWGKLFNAPVNAAVLILVSQDKWVFGYKISSALAAELLIFAFIINGIWTYAWYKKMYPTELKLGCDLNPEWKKLMENTKK